MIVKLSYISKTIREISSEIPGILSKIPVSRHNPSPKF